MQSNLRRYIEIVESLFGRKSAPPPTKPRQPYHVSPEEIARQYDSAEEYADNINPIVPMNSDPEHIHQRYEDERRRLIGDWNRWHNVG